MNCEQIRYELPTYLKNEADPEIQTQIESHLDSCLPCVQEKKNLTEMLTLFKQISWVQPSERFYAQMSEKFAVTFAEHPFEEASGNILENACFMAWDFFRYQVRHQPIWCLSTFAHAAIVLVLALIFLNPQSSSISQEELNYQISLELPKISDQELAASTARNTDLRKESDIQQVLSNAFQKSAESPPWTQKRLDPETKNQILLFLGETRSKHDQILREGTLYLKQCQESDGGFRLDSDSLETENRLPASSLALLVFLAEGNSHNHGEFKNVVYQGIQFLLRQQRISGQHKGLIGSTTHKQYLYHHSLATCVLLENYYLSGSHVSKKYEEILKEALSYLLKYQTADGGWSQTPIGKFSTLEVTSWVLTVLHLATPLHLSEQEEVAIPRARNFLKSLLREQGYLANQVVGPAEKLDKTARGMFCAQWLEHVFDLKILAQQIQLLQLHQEQLQQQKNLGDNLYFWYYGTLACGLYTHQQGELWQHWMQTLTTLVSIAQIQEGKDRGAIVNPYDTEFARGGKLYTTAIALLSLQTPYRY